MFAWVRKFFSDLLTEDTAGNVFCPVRVFGAGLVTTHVGATITQVVIHGTFDPVAFGTGSAALLAAVGAGIGIKSKMGADTP